jgi:phage gp46-like protein
MSDLRLTWNLDAADLSIAANGIVLDDGLETAVLLSLFTNRRAADTDTLPDASTDRQGYWGDVVRPPVDGDQYGSRLFLLAREKQLPSVLGRARDYALEALQWLLDDGVAAAVDVAASVDRPGWLVLHVTITRPTGAIVSFRFEREWAAQAARAEAA